MIISVLSQCHRSTLRLGQIDVCLAYFTGGVLFVWETPWAILEKEEMKENNFVKKNI